MKQLALITFLSAATFACAADVPITQDELVRRTQELYDAVVPGNQAPWKKYFADDCIFADEKGRIFDKPKLIADITPLPQVILEQSRSRTRKAELSGTPRYLVTMRTRPRQSSAKI